jgi:UDP-N-acetylglucosamine:LPS N-acetylglucosamine transferase
MDLAALNKKAIFIPTPGQTEQEYLGKYLTEKGMGVVIPQKEFNLESVFLIEFDPEPLSGLFQNELSDKVKEFLRRAVKLSQ